MTDSIPKAEQMPCPSEERQRQTRQRDALREVLDCACGPLLVQELLAAMRSRVDDVGVATVYRNLRRLVAAGEVLEIKPPGDSKRYQLASRGRQAFLRCVQCRRVFEMAEPA